MSASCARRSRIPLRILGNATQTNLASAARQSTFIFALSAGGLVANGATAQDATIAGKATLGMTAAETRLVATCCRAFKMIHADVYNERTKRSAASTACSSRPMARSPPRSSTPEAFS